MSDIKKILFVCTGNTCRSPMAETIYNNLNKNESMKAESRGLVVLFPEPINQKAEMVMKNKGLLLENHVSKQLSLDDFSDGTLVLCMTFAQKIKIADEFGIKDNLFTIKEYAGADGDVIDPYGGTVLEYEQCLEELTGLVGKIIDKNK